MPLRGRSLSAHRALLERIEAAGYTDVWTQETDAHDALTPLAFAAACTSRVRLGSAIASHFTRGPALLAQQAAALADAAPGRFVLGIGTSSPAIVTDWNGLPFTRPLARTRDVLGLLEQTLSGRRVDFTGETFSVRGLRLERPPPAIPPIHLAALGPGMLELAARAADGVLLSLVGADDVPVLLRVLAAGPGSRSSVEGFDVGLRIGVVVDEAPEVAREHCRRLLAAYLSVDRYAALQRRLGRAELLSAMQRAWAAGDRRAALAAVPESLVDALFVIGDVDACRRRLQRFRDAGVTTPIISLMRWRGDLDAIVSRLAEPL